MAEIHFSRGKSYELAPNCDEHPTEYVESEGERLIKQMVQKQMNTSVTLEQQLKKPKEFETCMEFVPITKYASGQIALAEFKEFAQKIDHLQDLKSSGLTEKEIDLLNDSEKGEKYFEEKYKKVENSALQSSLQEIKKKLQQRSEEIKNIKSASATDRGISRHELELSLSVKPESDHTKLLQFALSCQSNEAVDSRPLDHPINKLKEIEHELFSHLKPVSRKRKKKLNKGEERKSAAVEIHPQPSCSLVEPAPSSSPATLWDSCIAPNPPRRKIAEKVSEVHQYTCASKPLYTIREGKIVSLEKSSAKVEESPSLSKGEAFIVTDAVSESSGKLIPLKTIQANRIKAEEIINSPHFKNYCKGVPSEVLYVKNLSKSVEEMDLVSYFGNFEASGGKKIMYRLMSGRMRGQAFITFPDADKAAMALEALNGCYCKGKPLIIQFGRSKS
ncbi:hypothetical protein J437_LFUL001652 [Ladona fulva]|uniref:RRM domain-containing protein n=1 Tax=Ladona fulva TaxID=123851 RepID=A0A8K0K2H5_LADFU|nr:hypothetical protein J437_LFUL001652 [Ladona fulva]